MPVIHPDAARNLFHQAIWEAMRARLAADLVVLPSTADLVADLRDPLAPLSDLELSIRYLVHKA